MKRGSVWAALVAGVFLLLRGSSVQAHHSFATLYLEKDMIEVEGEVVEFQYRNPHTFIMVQGEERGRPGERLYAAEWVSVSQLDRMEIDKKFFHIGDPVRVWASPNKNPSDNRVRLKRIERTSDGWKWRGGRGDTR